MVGARGFEPPTPCSRSRCATRLRYAPNCAVKMSKEMRSPFFSRHLGYTCKARVFDSYEFIRDSFPAGRILPTRLKEKMET